MSDIHKFSCAPHIGVSAHISGLSVTRYSPVLWCPDASPYQILFGEGYGTKELILTPL